MAGSPNPNTKKLRDVLNSLDEGSTISPTELARQTGAGRKTVYDILNNEYQNKNFNLLGRTAASKKVQEDLYNKRMAEKVAYPSPVREGNKIVGVRWPSDEAKQMYVDDIKNKFSFPKGSLKTISNKDLAKKYLNNTSDAAIARIERINDHLSNELNLEYPKGDINQSAINRRERLEGSQKYLSDFENSILDKQEAIKKTLNKYYQNNPEEILNNEKIKTLIDARLENGKIITTPRYDSPDKYIELAEQGKLFDDFHTSPVKSGKRNIQFPVNKNIGPGKFNQGLMRQIEAYYKNTNNINMPQVIENKKAIDQFLKDYGFRVEIPNEGFIGDKSLAAVNRKTGQLPNIENTLDKLNIPKDIYLNHPDVVKIDLKNAEKIFDKAGVTQKEREAVNLINNQLNSGVDPQFIKKLYEKEIDMASNAITKIAKTGANTLKGANWFLNETFPGLVATDFVEGLTEGKTTLESIRDALIPGGHSYDIQQLLTPKEKEAQQRLGYKELPDILKEGEYGIGNINTPEEKYTPIQDIVDKYNIEKGETRAEEELKKEREERIKDFNREAYYGTPLMDSEVFSEKYANGGRVGFQLGGPANPFKKLRLLERALAEIKNNLFHMSTAEKYEGKDKAINWATKNWIGLDKSPKDDVFTKIEEAKQHLPKEYHSTLDDIKNSVESTDYTDAKNTIDAFIKTMHPDLKFENLPLNHFPMEDPLNDAFIILNPKDRTSYGRYRTSYKLDEDTGRGMRVTYDTWDPEKKEFLSPKEWKIQGAEDLEKGKEGLN
jgi:hypothetical protein